MNLENGGHLRCQCVSAIVKIMREQVCDHIVAAWEVLGESVTWWLIILVARWQVAGEFSAGAVKVFDEG